MLAREINRLRDVDRRVTDLLVEGMVTEVAEYSENDEGIYLVRVDLDFDGVAEYSVTAESGIRVELGERVWLAFPNGSLNATPYVLGGLRPRRTRLVLSGAAAGSGWQLLGAMQLSRYHTTLLAVGRGRVQYPLAENVVDWSGGMTVELAATKGGAPAGDNILGGTSSRHTVALNAGGVGYVGLGLALRSAWRTPPPPPPSGEHDFLRVESADDPGDKFHSRLQDPPAIRPKAEIWCSLRTDPVARAKLRLETGSETIGAGTFLTSVELLTESASAASSVSATLELYELG